MMKCPFNSLITSSVLDNFLPDALTWWNRPHFRRLHQPLQLQPSSQTNNQSFSRAIKPLATSSASNEGAVQSVRAMLWMPLEILVQVHYSACWSHLLCGYFDWMELRFGNRWGKNRAWLSHVAFKTHIQSTDCQRFFYNWQKLWFRYFFHEGFSCICHLLKRPAILSLSQSTGERFRS